MEETIARLLAEAPSTAVDDPQTLATVAALVRVARDRKTSASATAPIREAKAS